MKKFKIVNKKKFMFSVFVMLILILGMSLFICKSSFSSGEVKYKEIEVIDGDTLWSISKNENRTNPYYEGKDIRYIVYDINKLNNLGDSILKEGNKLLVPTI